MYVDDITNDFYEFLTGKRIFLMVHYDIDSICTCKILQNIFRYKHVLYTLSVVRGVEDLKTAFRENCKDVKYFVMINCGGTIDIVDVLEPDDDVVFFILDSHRPTDLCNIYSTEQIRLLSSPGDDYMVPEFDKIFREDSDEEDDSDEENDDDDGEEERQEAKRRRLGEEAIMKRREKRLWEDNRNKLLFEYSQFTYYAKASAITLFDLAWKLNKDDKDLLWYTIVALTEQILLNKIENSTYVLETDTLQSHASRLTNRSNDADVCKISYCQDLKLILYRHWSIRDSLMYSVVTAVTMKLWSHRGTKKLQELLAEMGLPLAQSSQTFQSMDLQLRKEFHGSLEKLSEKYGLQDLLFASFIFQHGYGSKYCASDIVYAMLAVLENSPKERSHDECFNMALNCLSKSKTNVLGQGIERAKTVAKTMFGRVQGSIDMKQIIMAGPFIYYIIPEGCLEWYMFSHPHILSLLAHFVLRAYVSMSRNKKAPTLPLIVSAPKNPETGTCILVGIPPLLENSPKNFFGKAFEQAAERIHCDASCDYFDTSYFEIFIKDRTRFFDALTSLLT